MRWRIIILFGFSILFGVGFVSWSVRERQALPPPAFSRQAIVPHDSARAPALYVYGNPALSLEEINIGVVYFVPARHEGEEGSAGENAIAKFSEAQMHLTQTLFPEIAAFHEKTFGGKSQLRFSSYAKLMFGKESAVHYEKEFLSSDAVKPLRFIEQEVRDRLLNNSGDLYDPAFVAPWDRGYPILLVIYASSLPSWQLDEEQVFVSGLTDDVGTTALVFRPFVDPQLQSVFPFGGSVIYHELLHTMGVPEQYDPRSPDVLAQRFARNDIMGRGVEKPIAQTYLGDDIKHAMGFSP